ncbi:hypothetical protein GR11A_00235 [Vibrio phage vB_VcorM_GR11A]|nr:hypothetical protein GR11A_00235 [Vibrio phage vB_VcorM_GR11A]
MVKLRNLLLAALVVAEFGLIAEYVVNDTPIKFLELGAQQESNITVESVEFPLQEQWELNQKKEATCLAFGVYAEGRSDTFKGQVALASSILDRAEDTRDNRVYRPTVCEVLLSSHQYESVKGDVKQLLHLVTEQDQWWLHPLFDGAADVVAWSLIQDLVDGIYTGDIQRLRKATHFWAPRAQSSLGRKPPKWEPYLKPLGRIGKHLYYTDVECVNNKCRYFTKERPYKRK